MHEDVDAQAVEAVENGREGDEHEEVFREGAAGNGAGASGADAAVQAAALHDVLRGREGVLVAPRPGGRSPGGAGCGGRGIELIKPTGEVFAELPVAAGRVFVVHVLVMEW